MLILKENAANSVPTPPSGKGTLFIDDSGTMSVKNSDGNVTTFPTSAASNTQVLFMDGTNITGEAAFTYNFNTNVLTVTGNVAAGNVLTDNLLYSNGLPWDLSDPGGSNTQIQFNDDESFGGSAAFTFNKTSNLVSMGGNLSVTGNANAGNINSSGVVTSTGNVSGGNLTTAGVVTATGNVSGGNLTTAGLVNATGNVSGGNLTTGGALSVTGNANVGNLGTAQVLATANVTAPQLISNIATGTAPLVVTSTTRVANLDVAKAGVANTVADSAQPNITSVGTLSSLSVTGNVSAGNLLSAVLTNTTNVAITANAGGTEKTWTFDTTGNLSVTGGTKLAVNGANVDLYAGSGGYAALQSADGNNSIFVEDGANGAYLASNLTGSAHVVQLAGNGLLSASGPVTATGTVTGGNLSTGGTLSVTGNSNVAAVNVAGHIIPTVANTYDLGSELFPFREIWVSGNSIKIGGATITANATSLVLQNPTGGQSVISGNTVASTASIANGTSNVNIPAANGNVNTSVNGTANVFVVTATGANVTGTLNATGNANAANFGTGGLIVATGNVTGGNLVTAGIVSATGNVTGGNLTTAGLVNATGNVTGGNLTTAGLVNATGNVTGGNLTTAGVLSVTGNANVGNLGTAGLVVATGNVTGGNLTTAGVVSATGNVSGGNLTTAGVVSATGNVSGGNLTTAGLVNATGNVTGGNLTTAGKVVASTLESNVSTGTAPFTVVSTTRVANLDVATSGVANTVNDAAQPNITSVGTLTTLTVSGTATAGNLSTGGNLTVSGTATITGDLDMTGNTISNLATPVASTDAATKQYVDDVAQGLNIHDSCAAATPDTLANITSGTITYNNGTAGVGATLVTTGTFNLIDGVNVQTAGTRILVKNEANAVFNGIYTYTNTTAITRATDFNSIPEVEAGDFTFVTGGTLYDNTGWVQTDSPTGIGTAGNTINFTQFSGAGTYNAGTGLTLTGSTFSVNASQTQITSVGTLGTLSVTGNANVGNLGTAGTVIASTLQSNVATGTAPLTVASTTLVNNLRANTAVVANTVADAAQPNITSVGTLTSLTVTGNASAGNISTGGVLSVTGNANVGNLGTAGLIVATGNVTGGNLVTSGVLSVTGNANVGNLGTAGLIVATGNVTGGNLVTSGALSVTGNANVGNLGTAGLVVATGNVTGGNLTTAGALSVTGNANVGNIGATNGVFTNVSGNGAALTGLNASNIASGTLDQARLANASVTLGSTALTLGSTVTTVAGLTSVTSTTFVGALTGAATTAGTVTTASQPNITSTGTLTSLGVSGTITAANITANTGVFTGNGSGLTALTGANVTGTVSAATTAGTVTTAAQPNITSTGTLTSLTVTGNIVCNGFIDASVNAAVSAAGSTQGTATVIASEINVVSTVASGAGVAFPTPSAGMRITIINTSANALLVYPASGGTINSLALNAAFSQAAGARLEFIATSATQWYTLNATYA
jgi:hypothetical protein